MALRKAKSQNTKGNTVMCPICEKAIVDSPRKSQDLIFSCQAWLHRCYAGLTHIYFDKLSDDNTLFYCSSCVADKQAEELVDLKSAVVALVQEATQLTRFLFLSRYYKLP